MSLYKKNVLFSLPIDLITNLTLIAQKEFRSRNSVVISLLKKALNLKEYQNENSGKEKRKIKNS